MISIEDMTTFCKKKGFVYQNSEIYGGFSGFWDFGPLGVELKNNIKSALWNSFVRSRRDVVGIDGAIIAHPKLWVASGHVSSFTDAILTCGKCAQRYRADHLVEDELKIAADGMTVEDVGRLIEKHGIKCKKCGSGLEAPKQFNLMFTTKVGAIEDRDSTSYLRPETAQLIFANFRLVMENARAKLPFGIAQMGKAFRNEISPRDFLFRSREFEQFEIEFFAHPKKIRKCPFFKDVQKMKVNFIGAGKKKQVALAVSDLVKTEVFKTEWHAYWVASFYQWFLSYGICPDNLRIREHEKEELAHYANACFDVEYKFPFGWKEIHGNADRTQFDLTQHIKVSGTDLSVFDEETREKVVPYVVSEPSQGIERAMLAFMFDAYSDDKDRGNVVLKLHPRLAPVAVGVFPLVNKLDSEAENIYGLLKNDFGCQYDRSGSIGRRYARADEIGVPFCVTVDFDSAKDGCVTVRDRDSTKQTRVKVAELRSTLAEMMAQSL
ncbi:MAG: glycine--tRNA ligase [archaeon]